jgi:hypothetical protein
MAKRFCCWLIVSGGQPTAFRSRDAESLLPTLRQLQRTQPDSMLKWFDRGRLWTSPSEAEAALRARRTGPSRGRDWRPGGSHVDPKAKYQLTRDQKRARFKRQQTQKPGAKPSGPPAGAGPARPGRPPAARRPRTNRRPPKPGR